MNCKEAMKTVIGHHEVHPVPFSIKFTVEARQNMLDRFGTFDPVRDTGTYVVVSQTNDGWKNVQPGFYKDYFGVIWDKTRDATLGVVAETPIKQPSLAHFRFPDPSSVPVYSFIEKNDKNYPEHFHMLSIGFALFERAWSLVGMENLMIYMMIEPSFVSDLLDKIAEYNVGLIENSRSTGIDCVHFGDDWGSQKGTLISPQQWREFIKPRFTRMCTAVKKTGRIVSLHCCGNVEAIVPDLIECGVDVFDPFQPEAMDIWKLRSQYRDRIAFWGGLSVQQTLPFGSVDQVRKETRDLLDRMAPGGGYILSPSHAVTKDVPVENILAYLDTAKNQ
jgi:uroporphyrinogen decarboxylase